MKKLQYSLSHKGKPPITVKQIFQDINVLEKRLLVWSNKDWNYFLTIEDKEYNIKQEHIRFDYSDVVHGEIAFINEKEYTFIKPDFRGIHK